VSNLNSQLKLIHLSDADNLDIDIGMELAGIGRVADEARHLLFQQVDIFE